MQCAENGIKTGSSPSGPPIRDFTCARGTLQVLGKDRSFAGQGEGFLGLGALGEAGLYLLPCPW